MRRAGLRGRTRRGASGLPYLPGAGIRTIVSARAGLAGLTLSPVVAVNGSSLLARGSGSLPGQLMPYRRRPVLARWVHATCIGTTMPDLLFCPMAQQVVAVGQATPDNSRPAAFFAACGVPLS